ncbi:SRPBCC family protein [Nocardioides sp. IC4_145]|uniref:SRPBCC family protein n=1 Tax=Nocardioides sp. IC4_145 TaxID=2714037 RepID=UPI00140B9E00|nr:SRPBCC family protein [Nocardioides sp. IC4_145]NHC23795.1 SRPBCC family protein [Nocardioides sp. IC4_145]
MDLRHEFTVPTDVEETWAHFNDVAAVAECFPGAVVTSVEDDTFTGTVKVKLGPIALVYGGTGTFVEKDETAHSFVVEAKGKDKRGNGTAGATVTLTMAPSGESSATDVVVVTDLSITGKPAQFGRGVMQDVSDKLLGQFVSCLEQRLTAGPAEAEPEPAAVDAPTPVEASAAQQVAADEVAPVVADAGPPPAAPRPAPAAGPGPADDALDLGASVLPVLLKSYGRQAGLGLLVVLVLLLLRRRRSR